MLTINDLNLFIFYKNSNLRKAGKIMVTTKPKNQNEYQWKIVSNNGTIQGVKIIEPEKETFFSEKDIQDELNFILL